MSVATALGLLLAARVAAADVSIVMDPSPPFGGTLTVGDFTESKSAYDELYTFSGEARNDTSSALALTVRARANGADVAGSGQTFSVAPSATTQLTYSYTDPGPSPQTVGLDFQAQGGTVSFVAGVFTAAPSSVSVPAMGSVNTILGAALMALGLIVSRRGRIASART